MPVEYRIPTGARQVARDYRMQGLGLPPGKAPQVVGLLANGFPEGDKFLAAMAEALRPHWPDTRFRAEQKAATDQLNIAIQEPLLTSMVDECDAVIIAWGHCGSCTSGVTRDAKLFTERGVPNVTLICDIFWEYSAWLGGAMGMSHLPRLQIPFPMAGTGEANMQVWAQRLAPQVIERLAASDIPVLDRSTAMSVDARATA